MKSKILKLEFLLIIVLLLVAGFSHGINMFNFPYYENDEGVYVSQSWSLITQGKLAPYTYWYDHAPGGWIFMAVWYLLTGGFFTFGFSINSGRVFMLVLQVLSALLLYLVTKKITQNTWVAALTTIIFSLSPLGIYFHRRVLLDNIMTFWVLLSIYLALSYTKKLRLFILSGITFGIAILSKENAIFFIPVMLYIVASKANIKHKSFSIVIWLAVTLLVTSTYFLYAFLKSELFPSGSLLGGSAEHVSLITTLMQQYSRPGGSLLDFENGVFWNTARVWIEEDPIIIYFGTIATIINLFVGLFSKPTRLSAFLALSMWVFLLRGGLVIEFYVIPLLPFLALNIAVFVWNIGKLLSRIHFIPKFNYSLALIFIFGLVYSYMAMYYATNVRGYLNLFSSNQTRPQIQAIDWILSRETTRTFYVIDNYGYVDLQEKGKEKNFKNAEWYWKVDMDPDIRTKLLGNKPDEIGYVALTPQMEHDITTAGLNLTLAAWHQSKPLVTFRNDGWGVEFWGTGNPERILTTTWESYKKDYIRKGKVSDTFPYNSTTSEAQSYALLRAVWINDKTAFDEVLEWTNTKMKQPSGLYSWKWSGSGLIDEGTASDADQDIALALIFAYKQWNEEAYLTEAKSLLTAIWKHEVVEINGKPYMTAANWANHENSITLNPSYLSPAYYRIFDEVDNTNNWVQLVQTSYEVLNGCTFGVLEERQGVLPPEWCALDKTDFTYGQPGEFQPRASEYAYNAFRVPWRVALDHLWYKSQDSKDYLSKLSILGQHYSENDRLPTAFRHDGSVWEEYESVIGYAANLAYFYIERPAMAKEIYENKILSKLYEDSTKSYWEDPANYYTQNWAWFATALYTNNTPNLWSMSRLSSL